MLVYLFLVSDCIRGVWFVVLVFFFFKQKTAYEMRISDWSSGVCSSDLRCFGLAYRAGIFKPAPQSLRGRSFSVRYVSPMARAQKLDEEIGRASCRDRVCQYV